jgi:hypothetical protein
MRVLIVLPGSLQGNENRAATPPQRLADFSGIGGDDNRVLVDSEERVGAEERLPVRRGHASTKVDASRQKSPPCGWADSAQIMLNAARQGT